MKRILIDLSKLGTNNQNAILGIKYFLNKNKEDELTVIGESNNTVTIHQNKRILMVLTDVDNNDFKIDEEFKEIKEKNIQLLLTLLKTEHFNSFVTFNSLEELKPYINKYFIKKTSPLLICSFANYETHKCTILGDIGYNLKPTANDLSSYLIDLKEYATKIYNFKTTKFKILNSPCINIKDYKSDSDFSGLLESKDLYNANIDIVLGDAHSISTSINAIDGAISVYDKFMKNQVRKSFGLRYFVYPMFRGVVTAFHMNIDQKFTSGGITLLGYDKKIVFVNKDTIAMGVKTAIDNCAKF